jgi:hypothetical protein
VIRHCRACEVGQLSGHPGFAAALAGRQPPPEVVYLWEDGSVTELPLADSESIYTSDSAQWRELCALTLGQIPAA